MLKDHSRDFESLLQSSVAVVGALVFAVLISLPGASTSTASQLSIPRLFALGVVAALVWPVLFRQLGLYSWRTPFGRGGVVLAFGSAATLSTLVIGATAFLVSAPVPGAFPALCGLVQTFAAMILRAVVFTAMHWLWPHSRHTRNVLIVGSGPRAAYVRGVIERTPGQDRAIVGFIDDGAPPGGPSVPPQQIYKLSDMIELMRDQVIDEVIVACPRGMLPTIVSIVDACAAAGVPITLLADIFGDFLPAPQVQRLGALPALSFAPVHQNAAKLAVKRLIDILGATVGLVLVAPVLLLAALAIRLGSRGPVLFQQTRCTLNGRHFSMLKLRTMTADADEHKLQLGHLNEMDGPTFKISNDPRSTTVGRLLRRSSLDELPQLWNVLRGDMSLVGPRPQLPSEVFEYRTFERRRLSMRPGLTCIWQVSGRNKIRFEDWVRLDLEYIDTWSLSKDFLILLRTIPAVLTGAGAS